MIYAFRLAHKHNFQLVAVRVTIDVLGDLLVDSITLNWHVNSHFRLKVNDVVFESDILVLEIPDLLK